MLFYFAKIAKELFHSNENDEQPRNSS